MPAADRRPCANVFMENDTHPWEISKPVSSLTKHSEKYCNYQTQLKEHIRKQSFENQQHLVIDIYILLYVNRKIFRPLLVAILKRVWFHSKSQNLEFGK